jgi:uncharacterized membrane protein YgcG
MTHENYPLPVTDATATLSLPSRGYGAAHTPALSNATALISAIIFSITLFSGVYVASVLDFYKYLPLSLFLFAIAVVCLVIAVVVTFKVTMNNDKLREESKAKYVDEVFIPWMKKRYSLNITHDEARKIMAGEARVIYTDGKSVRVGLKQNALKEIYLDNVIDLKEFTDSKRSHSSNSGDDAGVAIYGDAGTRFSVEGVSSGGDGSFSDGGGSDGGGGDGGGGGGGGD